MNKKWYFATGLTLLTMGVFMSVQTASQIKHQKVIAEDATYTMILSSSKPVVDSKAYNESGYGIWTKGDTSSGVNWNNGSNKVSISKHGYIQTLSAINGIKSVKIDLASGSVTLYHDWVEPSDLETAEYEDATFSSTGTHTYSGELPSRIRIIANVDSVINSITIKYSCATGATDENVETIEQGLENGYFDSGSIGKYARTSFVTSDTCSDESKRSLKLQFNGTTNNYVSFNTSKNRTKGLTTADPDFSHTRVTFKAKFSDDYLNQDVAVCPLGSSWAHPGYIKANRTDFLSNGWIGYSLDLSSYSDYADSNDGIRLNIRPEGIDSTNKATAWVLLDDVQLEHVTGAHATYGHELPDDGWENLPHDEGWERTSYSFDTETKFGFNSKSSLMLKYDDKGKGISSSMKVCTVFDMSTAADNVLFKDHDLSSGILSFNYKTKAIDNANDLYIGVIQGWDSTEQGYKVLHGTYLKDGWYGINIDLSTFNVPSQATIRLSIGWEVAEANREKATMWIDNLRYNENPITETVSEGLENIPQDTGWEVATVTADTLVTASETSKRSMRLSWSRFVDDANRNFVCFQLNKSGSIYSMNGNEGILEAKFMFSGPFVEKKIRLVLIDSDWKGGRYNIPVTPLGNGWYQMKVDLSTVSQYLHSSDAEYDALGLIRLGFGFNGLPQANYADCKVWVDDVFYSFGSSGNVAASTYSKGVIWKAYDNELVLQDSAPTSGRNITSSNPLQFECLRNETESAQLMVDVKGTKGITAFNFKAGNLYSEKGAKIPASKFEVLAAKYIQVTEESAEYHKKGTNYSPGLGWYPDALVPMDNLIAAGENSIPGAKYSSYHKEQTIWVNVDISKETLPGTYTGEGVLTLDGTNYTIPMKVVVHKASLPDYRTNKNYFGAWFDQIEKCVGSEHYNRYTRDQYLNFFYDKNVSAGAYREGDWGKEPEDYANLIATKVAGNDKINTYRSIFDSNYDTVEEISEYLEALIDKNIEMVEQGKDVNFFEKLITYFYDEPSTPEDWQTVRNCNNSFTTAINSLKDKLNDYPEIKESFVNQVSVTPFNQARNEDNYDALITPCPTYDYLNSQTERDAYHQNFNQVWWYGCIVPVLPYPTFHLDGSLTGIRMLTYMQYNYDIAGSLYWNVCFAQRKDNNTDMYDIDVWTDPFTWGMGACDGRLSYPGTRYGIIGPITTQRLEELSASYDDYEYFALIENKLGSRNSTVTQLSNTMHFSEFFSGTQLTLNSSNPSDFATYRRNLLNYIDSLY